MKKPVLFATDFSRLSLVAFPHAVEAAKQYKTELVILHVLPAPVTGDALQYAPAMMYAEMKSAVLLRTRKELGRLVERARRAKVRARSRIAEGLAHEEIVRAAKGLRAGLIVIATHGRSGLSRMLLGSVAMQVIGGASCPVLTIRSR
jgi:universal stress protein A